jgi:hypothetical protein
MVLLLVLAGIPDMAPVARRYIDTTPCPRRARGEIRKTRCVLFKVRPTYVMTFGPPPTS